MQCVVTFIFIIKIEFFFLISIRFEMVYLKTN
jgi:hypothetical protein